MPHGTVPGPWVDALLATSETVLPAHGPTPAASAEETETVLRWLEQPGLRMARGSWHSALESAARHLSLLPA